MKEFIIYSRVLAGDNSSACDESHTFSPIAARWICVVPRLCYWGPCSGGFIIALYFFNSQKIEKRAIII